MSLDANLENYFFFKGVFIYDLLEIENPYSIEELEMGLVNYEKEISSGKHELQKSFKAFSDKLKRIIQKRKLGSEKVFENYYGIIESGGFIDGIKKTQDKIIRIRISPTYIRNGIKTKISVITNSIDPFENCEGDFSIKPVTTNYTVIIPPGALSGDEVLRFQAKGDQEIGCRRGDLIFIVRHALPNNVMLNGIDIYYNKTVSEEEEKEGFEIKFLFYTEELKKRFEPKEIIFDQKIKIGSGKGLPDKNGLEYGDLYVMLNKEEKSI